MYNYWFAAKCWCGKFNLYKTNTVNAYIMQNPSVMNSFISHEKNDKQGIYTQSSQTEDKTSAINACIIDIEYLQVPFHVTHY